MEKKANVEKTRAGYEAQRGDNSIRPFNSASKVNGVLMSETVESANNMLKSFYQSLFSELQKVICIEPTQMFDSRGQQLLA